MPRALLSLLVAVLVTATASASRADPVCPDSSYCTLSFGCTWKGLYQNGQPLDRVLVVPDGQMVKERVFLPSERVVWQWRSPLI